MDENLKNSIAGLLSEANRDEMWKKFFSSVEYTEKFKESLESYKNLKNEIVDLQDDIFEIILQDWFEARNKINSEVVALENEKNDIQKVLDVYSDSLSDIQKEIYEERLKQLPSEINQAKAKHFKLSVFKKQKEENETKIQEKQGYLNNWYNDLEINFGSIKDQMIFKIEEYNKNLDKEYDHLKLKLENVKKNLKYAEIKEEEMKKFGESSSQFKEASEVKHNSMTAVINVENKIKEFRQNLAKVNVDTIKFIHFLKTITFEEFFEKLEKNKFSLEFGNNVSKPKDGEDKPVVVPEPDNKPEQVGGSTGESESPVPENKPQEIEIGGEKLPGGNGGSTVPGEEDDKTEEKVKDTNTGKKKVKGERDIPQSIFEKIGKIVPALKNFFGRKKKNSKDNATDVSALATVVSENEYVANDKLLLGVISANITATFDAERDDSKSKDYFDTYSKIMKLNDEDVQKIFNDISNKEEILNNIGTYCGLSDEEYVALLNKVNGEVVQQKSR